MVKFCNIKELQHQVAKIKIFETKNLRQVFSFYVKSGTFAIFVSWKFYPRKKDDLMIF